MTERTFLAPLNDANDLMHELDVDLRHIGSALITVGNEGLAKRIFSIADDLRMAQKSVCEGRDWALRVHVNGAEAATTNMVKAALAMSAD